MALVLALTAALFAYDNKEFLETVEAQRADGFTWQQIKCREVDPTLPAITITTPTGKELVCNKLVN
jgi:hypothetical protein